MTSTEYNIYIPKKVHNKIDKRKKYLGELIEKKFKNDDLLRKYNKIKLLRQTIIIKFTNRIPKFVMYDDQIFGPVTFKRNNENDVCYPIQLVDDFSKYLKHNEDFFLSIGYGNDGFGGYFARIYGVSDFEKLNYDFTDYAAW